MIALHMRTTGIPLYKHFNNKGGLQPPKLKGKKMENLVKVYGVYTRSGGGYCFKCAQCIEPEEITTWTTAPYILCDNCGIHAIQPLPIDKAIEVLELIDLDVVDY